MQLKRIWLGCNLKKLDYFIQKLEWLENKIWTHLQLKQKFGLICKKVK